jgi:molybdate transport system ATP-binding protein
VLLLDEPLGALDLPLRRRILPYLARVRERFALPTLFVSHDPTEVRALCDEVVVLAAGRVRAQGRPDVVLRECSGVAGGLENVLAGRVAEVGEGAARLVLDEGGTLSVPSAGLASGERAVVALGADEVLVALEAPARISARNVLAARLESLAEPGGGEVRLVARLESGTGARLALTLTTAARRELALAEGQNVFLVFKASSCRVLTVVRA